MRTIPFFLLTVVCLISLLNIVCIAKPISYSTKTIEGAIDKFEIVDAKHAYMLAPTGICLGIHDDIFVSDAERHVVFRLFDNMSKLEVYAGYVTNGFNGDGEESTKTLLNSPTSVSVNPLNGDLYIADQMNNLIRIVSSSTRLVSSISHTFNKPTGVYVSTNQIVYIADTDNNVIKKYVISTQTISIIAGGGYLTGGEYDGVDAKLLKLQSPKNVHVVSNGDKDIVYFTDAERVRSIDENGYYRMVDGGVAQSNLYGLFVLDNQIFTSSKTNHFVQMKTVKSSETLLSIGNSEGYAGDNQLFDSSSIKFYEPSSLIVTTQQAIIVADKSNNCIRKIDLQTKMVTTIAGGIVNHPYSEDISPLKMNTHGQCTFPFVHKNELYFVEKGLILRKVSNGKMTTILGCENDKLKYSANLPQRIHFPFANLLYLGNGDLLISTYANSYFSTGTYHFNVENQFIRYIVNSPYMFTMVATLDSFENSLIYYQSSAKTISVMKNSTNLYSLPLSDGMESNSLCLIQNFKSNGTNSLLIYSGNTIFEYVDYLNGTFAFERQVNILPNVKFTSFTNSGKIIYLYNTAMVYQVDLDSLSLRKVAGYYFNNVSNSLLYINGYNGENIPAENSALSLTKVVAFGERLFLTSQFYISEIINGRISTIVGLNPLVKPQSPKSFVRDSSKKLIYYFDNRTLKRFNEKWMNSTSLSDSLSTNESVNVRNDLPFLTLNIINSLKGNCLFSTFDKKIYIKDRNLRSRIIRIDPETLNFETIIGTGMCGDFITYRNGFSFPCPITDSMTGMTFVESSGDLLISTDSPFGIYRYNMSSGMISLEFSFSNNNSISSDGIVVNNQTNPGIITNIQYRDGFLYISTMVSIRRIEKDSNNQYYLRTLVGNSVQGYSGDRLHALESSLDEPDAFYVKKNGDIIILDGGIRFSSNMIRMYEKQSGLLIDLAGKRASTSTYNGDGKSIYTIFASFTKQVEFDEESGEIFVIDSNMIRKLVPQCDANYVYNSWNNSCDPILSCNGTVANSLNVCNGHGQCVELENCKCLEGFEGKYCDLIVRKDEIGDSTNILIISIVVPVVGSLFFLITILTLVLVIVVCCKKRKTKEIEKMEINNVELIDLSSFLPTSSLIISSSVNSSKSTETENMFSRYSNVVRIGNGAFGSVFKAIDTKQNKLKAIKVIKFETFTDLNTVMKEASQLSNVKHPNIVKLNDYFISNDNLLIIDMDFYEFGDLTKLMKHSPCKETLIKQILKQMLHALKYIHEDLNIIHRDIKPSNIFIKNLNENHIEVVLADFGLAKKFQESKGQSYVGTPLYMSPEIALGSSYSFNTDIFSLGVSIYQIMTNDQETSISNLLMRMQSEKAIEILTNQMKESNNNEYSPELVELVLQMLQKDPSLRPQASQLLSLKYFK